MLVFSPNPSNTFGCWSKIVSQMQHYSSLANVKAPLSNVYIDNCSFRNNHLENETVALWKKMYISHLKKKLFVYSVKRLLSLQNISNKTIQSVTLLKPLLMILHVLNKVIVVQLKARNYYRFPWWVEMLWKHSAVIWLNIFSFVNRFGVHFNTLNLDVA